MSYFLIYSLFWQQKYQRYITVYIWRPLSIVLYKGGLGVQKVENDWFRESEDPINRFIKHINLKRMILSKIGQLLVMFLKGDLGRITWFSVTKDFDFNMFFIHNDQCTSCIDYFYDASAYFI